MMLAWPAPGADAVLLPPAVDQAAAPVGHGTLAILADADKVFRDRVVAALEVETPVRVAREDVSVRGCNPADGVTAQRH